MGKRKGKEKKWEKKRGCRKKKKTKNRNGTKEKRRKGKKEGKGREILSKFATPGKISSLQPVPKNLCFYSQKASASRGLRSPAPYFTLLT